ncbi:MAG: hypothetical protein HKN68_08055 [Saprospiraceae bacterium]|nr:hypothetical protein [Saprospiraceae bacterium]
MDRKFTDKEIEKLFQAGLNSPEIAYREDAWASMELLLDKKKRKKRRIFFWLFFGVMLMSTMIIGGHFLIDKNESAEEKFTGDIVEMDNTPVQPSEQLPDSNTQKEDLEEVLSSTGNDIIEIYDVSMSNLEGQIEKRTSNSNILNEGKDESEIKDGKNKVVKLGESSKVLKSDIEKKVTSAVDDRKITISALQKSNRDFEKLEFDHLLNIDSPDKSIIEKENESLVWMFSFYGGPEWSSTPSSTYGNMDWSLDMYISRMVGNKIGFYTGVGYISDSYVAGKYDYKPERGFWTRSIAPDRTIARCRILDFPLGIQYHLEGQEQSGIVLSAGVTSQYMAREVYYYKYENEEPDFIKNWMGNGENFHWFSGAQFSVEYRVNVGKGMTIGFNPYYNLPLKGIGHGNIKISNIGFRTGVNF